MKLIYKVLLAVVLIQVECKSNIENEDILLKIGNYKLSFSEYKLLKNYKPYQSMNYKQLENKLLEEGRILAYSLDHHYDTIAVINKQLDYAMRYYASKVDGYVWNKKVKPHLLVTKETIINAYHKRSKLYQLELINFTSKAIFQKYNRTKRTFFTENDFNILREKAVDEKKLKVFSYSTAYPFYPFGMYANEIAKAKINDIIGPVETLQGFYLIHVIAKRGNITESFEQTEPTIKQELIRTLRDKYIFESQKQIMDIIKPYINEATVSYIASKFNSNGNEWPEINPKLLLMRYNFEENRQSFMVSDFKEFVHSQPVFIGLLNNPDDITKMLKTFLIDKYLFAEAQRLGIEDDEDYQLYRKIYQQRILIGYCHQIHNSYGSENFLETIKSKYPIEINRIGNVL